MFIRSIRVIAIAIAVGVCVHSVSVRCDIMTCNAYNRGYCADSQNNATLMIGAPQGSSPLDIVIEPTM